MYSKHKKNNCNAVTLFEKYPKNSKQQGMCIVVIYNAIQKKCVFQRKKLPKHSKCAMNISYLCSEKNKGSTLRPHPNPPQGREQIYQGVKVQIRKN